MLDRDLHRIGEDPAVSVPVHVAHHPEAQSVELLERLDVGAEEDVIAAEPLAQVAQVAQADRQVVVAVVRDEQRPQPELLRDHIGLVVRVLAAGDRDDAVVVRAVLRAILLEDLAEFLTALRPVDSALLVVDATAGADALVVVHRGGGRRRRIDAASAVVLEGDRRHSRATFAATYVPGRARS
jgi:hypothetical protein